MSAAELHWLPCRLVGGKLEKAQRGTLRFRLPVGLVYDAVGRIVLDPDEEIQQAVRRVFEGFTPAKSALAVVKDFADHGLQMPTRRWRRAHKGEVVWCRLRHGRVLAMLRKPFYAGAYVDGRTQTRRQPLPGETPRVKGYSRQVPREQWPIVMRDHHEGYSSWEQFQRHLAPLGDNRTWQVEDRRGAVRAGAALLQDLVRCGVCGRRMTGRYGNEGRRPIYVCAKQHNQFADKTCQFVRGDGIDQAVAQRLRAAIAPAQLSIALEAIDYLEAQARARYEVDLARRRYQEVEPEHRLVARTLERDWNAKRTILDQLEREYATRASEARSPVSAAERQRIMELAHDVPSVWHAPTTTNAERKQLVRWLIKDVTLTKRETTIQVEVRWQTHACSRLEVDRPKRAPEVKRTAPAVVERVWQLAPTHTDAQIATTLNTEGWRSGQGSAYTASKVEWVRSAYGLKSGCPLGPAACPHGQRGDGR